MCVPWKRHSMHFHFKSPLTILNIGTEILHLPKDSLMRQLSSLKLVATGGLYYSVNYTECYKVQVTHVLLGKKKIQKKSHTNNLWNSFILQ